LGFGGLSAQKVFELTLCHVVSFVSLVRRLFFRYSGLALVKINTKGQVPVILTIFVAEKGITHTEFHSIFEILFCGLVQEVQDLIFVFVVIQEFDVYTLFLLTITATA
jgi:hypothetical protein